MGSDLTNLEPDNIPWPEKGDKLFAYGEDWWHNACLNYSPGDWNKYALGYKEAGDALIKHVKDSRRYQDLLVFPIVFLYRQYIELRLKQVIRDGNELFDEPSGFP